MLFRSEQGGVEPTLRFLERLNVPNVYLRRVPPLVANHLAHLQTVNDRSVRRLAKRLEPETIHGLCAVITADHSGRPPQPPCVPEGVKALLAKAEELRLRDAAPKPILQGRHLIAAGLTPADLPAELLPLLAPGARLLIGEAAPSPFWSLLLPSGSAPNHPDTWAEAASAHGLQASPC